MWYTVDWFFTHLCTECERNQNIHCGQGYFPVRKKLFVYGKMNKLILYLNNRYTHCKK